MVRPRCLDFQHTTPFNRRYKERAFALLDLAPGQRVLDVGCGLGAEGRALKELLPDAEAVAVDLNLALLGSPHVGAAPSGVHFAVASLFALPFRPRSFDLVYAQGVLHHSYSTRTALERVAAHVAEEGYLFVWLYGREDHLGLSGRRAIATRAALALERVLRPALAASPPRARGAFFAGATRAVHPLLKPRMRHKGRWERENTEHHLRDWLSPRYAHRHGWNEVLTWLEELGFDVVDVQSPTAYRRLYGDRLWGVGLTGRRRPGT